MVRTLLVGVMVLAQTAHADPLVGVFGNYTHLAGVQAGGFGLDVELRAKRGAVQYFAEGAVAAERACAGSRARSRPATTAASISI